MHTVLVMLEARPGLEAELEQILKDLADGSRAEPASVLYHVHRVKDNEHQFILYEQWQSAEQHAKQFEKSYVQALGQRLASCLSKPYEVYIAELL
ncbi:MAG: hypothetical protein COV52_08260 [Gammaproteobacteria bacterium CG11_big_fil_rev_8_21_14_0_20_46_22]|nr:MAG: hypothetical protein COW05_06265 [Gammaproteobacteria bacterium CG12_big_fil_rev_8_21_14_0_65_46_12]PIR10600.1 MAG: hypothetical protein COV52_08260 [Gammaproteobacteria bacterium CG11_big_fil_rev_8_21_14_0_20_46_22]